MVKRMIIMLVVVAIVLGGIFGFQAFKTKMIKQYLAANSAPPQTVSSTNATTQEWRTQIQSVGNIKAVNGADLSYDVAGIVDEVDFQSGDDVKAGQLLMHLRADDDTAKLKSLMAVADLAHIIYDRDQKQLAARAISQATLDSDAANLKNAEAQVAEQQAIVAKKTLRAPFAGHLGIRAVDLGQYVNAGTAIVTLQALDPIYADFYVPEQQLAVLKVGQSVAVQVDAYPGQDFTGEIAAIDAKVESDTRNVEIRAIFKNPDHKLLPGMYARIEIDTGSPEHYVTLPQSAVAYNSYGDTVFLVDQKNGADGKPVLTARQTFVTLGPTRGDQVAVLTGVKEGDVVVSAGQVKLRNGSPLIINNSIQQPNNPNPNVVDP
jgi:membrane fusion protein (multidrug efflux system)